MTSLDFYNMLGYTNNAYIFNAVFGNPSSIILTDNPPFTQQEFSSIFPVFVIGNNGIPQEVFSLFLAMANACIKEARYKSQWKYMMGLFIAHNLTLYLRANEGDPGAESALKNSNPTLGIAQSKSVDGLSISYELLNAATDLAGYGTWNLTTYGQQLATMSKLYRGMGMFVNG